MAKKKLKFHELEKSPFFRLPTRKRLAVLLWSSRSGLNRLVKTDPYAQWYEEKKNGGKRLIEAPHEPLKRIQHRVAELLNRITPPPYLTNPVKGRSYVDNARMHLEHKEFVSLDIADYFPSCSANRVAWFFRTKMQCPPDVTAILVGLLTRNGHLPQGSPASPIIAYLSNAEMWDELYHTSREHGCTMSAYADDVTISGERVSGDLIWQLKNVIEKYGFDVKLDKEKRTNKGVAEITGVICAKDGLKVPNRQRKKVVDLKASLRSAKNEADAKHLSQRIRGLKTQRVQVEGRP